MKRTLLSGYFTIVSILCVSSQDVEYFLKETDEVGFSVGNLRTDSRLKDSKPAAELQFRLLTEGNPHSKLFQIDNTGELKVAVPVDRELLCPFKSVCNLQIEVAVSNPVDAFFMNLKVKIVVQDVNDNAPKFPNQTWNLYIPESSTKESVFTLPGPSDNDTDPNNSLQSIEIIPTDVPFTVQFTKNLDGTSVVSVSVTEPLDREFEDIYLVSLLAKDGGDPQLSSIMNLQIHITDINDNAPIFTHSVYNVTINESTALGYVILQVSASDRDEGPNGELVYRLSSHQDDKIGQYFAMEGSTGDMILNQRLPSGHIRVIIEASDRGQPSKTTQAFVEVDILDTINNPPAITVNIISGTDKAMVLESARVGFPVAHIKIQDPDTGVNSIVTCFSQTRGFDLLSLEEKEYKVVIADNLNLDYEVTKNYTVRIFCKDAGNLNTTADFKVAVVDVNDNSPVFMQTTIVKNIPENNAVGDTIVRLAATDKDSGNNSRLIFSLSPGARANFTVESQTQGTAIVKARIQFDREDEPQYVFNVFAIDSGTPAQTATATVTVNVLDINDERPAFWKQAYAFNISENMPLGTAVGNVSAFDLDTGDGGLFSLTLAKYQPENQLPFTILQNGTILTTSVLDRESTNEYVFQAVATDHGRTALSGMSQVTVTIIDVNDNEPKFVFPNDENFSVTVYVPTKADSVVAQIQATDADSHSNIQYKTRDLNSSGLFEINNITGEIYTLQDIDARVIGTYFQAVMISNTEPNSKSVSQKLKIIVTHSSDAASTMKSNDQYIVIVIVLVCLTVLIAAAVLVALCYLRKRDKDQQLKRVYEHETASYGIPNPVTEVDGVSTSNSGNSSKENMMKARKKDDLDSSNSTVNGHIITGTMVSTQLSNGGVYKPRSEPVLDREHQRQNQLMSFRLHQALQRINSESGPHEQSKILAANAKVMEWRDAQRRADDHSTSSGEITTGDSGHGSDDDSHIMAERSPHKIRLGVGAFQPQARSTQVPPRSKVSPIKGTKMTSKGHNGPKSLPHHMNIGFKNDTKLPGYNPYGSQMSPRSDTIDDNDDTTTSGSYSITVEDIKSELPEFDFLPVKDVYV